MRPCLLAFSFLLLCACETAPSTVTGTLELSPELAKLKLRLQDVKSASTDGLGQLLQYQLLQEALAKPQSIWPWAPATATSAAFEDGGKLDMTVELSMPRAQFDKCAKARCADERGECSDFLVKLCDGQLALGEKKGLLPLPPTPEQWPASATRLEFAYRVDEEVNRKGTSLLPGKRLFEQHAQVAPAVLAFWKAYGPAFTRGELKQCAELARTRPAGALFDQVVRSERQRLLHAYLSGGVAGATLSGPPPQVRADWESPYRKLVPPTPLPAEATFRLRVAYDDGQLGLSRDGLIGPGQESWALNACQTLGKASAAQRQFCERLRLGAR